MTDSTYEHVMLLIGGGSAVAAIAHAVNTFPTPANKYAAWLLGTLQLVVGQRIAAANTKQGLQTVATGVTNEEKKQKEQ